MHQKTLSLWILGLSLVSGNALAGAVSGGGGKAVVCRNADRSIRTAELLDLWEAREIYGREIIRSDKPMKELVMEGIERLKHAFLPISEFPQENGENLRGYLDRNSDSLRGDTGPKDKTVKRLRGVTLNDTNDSFELARPSECAVEQVVNFVDLANLPRIYVNQDLWESLDNVNQAALVLHESLYRTLREEFGESNSLRTRRAIGFVMAGNTFRSTYEMLQAPRITCSSADQGTRIHMVTFVPTWGIPGRPRYPMESFYVERVAGVPTMGFVDFGIGLGGPLERLFHEMLDTSKPLPPGPLPYNHLTITHSGDIEPELKGLLEVEGTKGQIPKVVFTLGARVLGTTPIPFRAELSCTYEK
ncbi:MAG: hypothetical protein EOP11_16215 [Proteobacteria bacterium]|nr:MAG: hypothetical protein EOP11_16215 [Pseudomonadota bacterium]